MKKEFSYSLNAKVHREPDFSAIRWSRLLCRILILSVELFDDPLHSSFHLD
jgi:hypothetical protein